jgi:aminoglycoside 3-N-acetyltransferase
MRISTRVMNIKTAKKTVKVLLRYSYSSYVDLFHAFKTETFRKALRDLGVLHGDTLLVHSAYDAFRGFSGKPTDVLQTLGELVGPDGTLLMPSIPFTGTAVDYVHSGAITDLARTPSRMGLLSEIFRRQVGTIRSVSPTHPVLARGARAQAMIKDHAIAKSPCGAGSPFEKLLEVNGKILFLGVSIESMTFFHYLEEKFENRLAVSPFTSEVFAIPVQVGGKRITVNTRLFNPQLSRRRRIEIMLPELRRMRAVQEGKIGVLPLSMVAATAARDAFVAILERKKNFYVG